MDRQDLVELLRERGQRMTPQRQLILEAVQQLKGHVRLRPCMPGWRPGSAGQHLDGLPNAGAAAGVGAGHAHPFRRWSGTVPPSGPGGAPAPGLPPVRFRAGARLELLEPLGLELRRRHGFQADLAHFALVGLCQACAPNEA